MAASVNDKMILTNYISPFRSVGELDCTIDTLKLRYMLTVLQHHTVVNVMIKLLMFLSWNNFTFKILLLIAISTIGINWNEGSY